MIKKILYISIPILIVAGISFWGYNYFKKEKPYASKLINGVPLNSVMIFECHDFISFVDGITNKNNIWAELKNIPSVNNVNNYMLWADSILKNKPVLNDIFKHKPIIVSLHLTGVSKFDYLFLFNLENSAAQEQLESAMNEIISNNGIVTKRDYDNVEITDVKINKPEWKESFSYTIQNGTLIFSFSSMLVEESLRQMSADYSLLNEKSFSKISSTAGKNVDGNLYVNFKMLPKLLAMYAKEEYSNDLTAFSNFADWSELDATIKPDALLLNGFTYASDSINNFLQVFINQSPEKLNITEILPASTSFFISLGISNTSAYFTDYQNYLDKQGRLSSLIDEIKKIDNKYDVSIKEVFGNTTEKEVALAYSEINSLNVHQNAYVILKLKSKSETEDKLMEFFKAVAQKENKSFDSYIETCEIDNETKFPVYVLPVNSIPKLLFGPVFSKVNSKYLTLVDNYMIFAGSIDALNKFIHANILQKTLDKDVNFNSFAENLSSKYNFYFYCNLSRSSDLLATYFNEELAKSFKENAATLNKLQALGYQFSSSHDMTYNSLYFKYNPVYKEPPHTVWESHLDTVIRFKPKLVINHTNDENEIFIQDLNNTIYLINSAGRILWKKPIDEKIISEVYQIDCFDNKKFQYLFNTESKIYLVDRNGNHVERFPIKLPNKATNGLSVFDYENNNNYRIFIADNNRNITVFSQDASVITGWDFGKTENIVRNEIQHFKVEDKDFIVVSDSLKTYILDRKGSLRVKLNKQFSKSRNNGFFLDNATKGKQARLITTDSTGNIMSIYFDGKVESMNISKYTYNHFFECQDVNADDIKDYIFVDENLLEVYSGKNNKLLFNYEFPANITERPVYYYFASTDRKIGIVCDQTNEIYLFNSNGNIYDGFPLRGKTLFSIGFLGASKDKFNLVVGSDVSFLYNYEVN